MSGMAKGIDSYAHTACLKAGGYTLAFMANGLDICYPPEHQTLMEEIIEKGAILSPYPPGIHPRQEYFPHRNKLLAAWADELLVAEAAERSGALITAQYAMEYGRKVLAVPNSIYSSESAGANRLILSGVQVYLEPQQLIDCPREIVTPKIEESVDPSHRKKCESTSSLNNPQEQAILAKLDQPRDINNLLDICNGEINLLIDLLCQMELEGKVIIRGQRVEIVPGSDSHTDPHTYRVLHGMQRFYCP